MSLRGIVAAAMIAVAGVAAGAANAAPVYVQSVEAFAPGTGNRGASSGVSGLVPGDDPAGVLARVAGAPDGAFLSLGIGGSLVLGFGDTGPFTGGTVFFERTNGSPTGWPESVKVFVSLTNTSVGGDWTEVGSLSNTGSVEETPITNATRGYLLNIGQTFNYLKLVDTSTAGSSSNAGWDVDAVRVAPIPVPAALPLLLAGIGGLAWAGRRRNRADA